MAKLLTFTTDLGNVTIKLLDTAFVDFWLEHFLSLQENYSLNINQTFWPHLKDKDLLLANELINTILTTVDKINSLDWLSPMPETITRDQLLTLDMTTQQVLNRLHRYLVVASEYKTKWCLDSDPVFTITDEHDVEFAYLLNLVNQKIHALEEYVVTEHKQGLAGMMQTCEILVNGSKYTDVTVYQDGVDKEIPNSMVGYLKLVGHDVWIKKDILGKDYITAFIDHDDPTEFDIRTPPMISGGLQIDFGHGRIKFFSDPRFQKWLGTKPVQAHGNYPLGDVIEGKQNLIGCKEILFVGVTNQ